ncbi:bifunctional adenosylcobinamide kinase/adenosylcobinamide-phosphate guanylyltransferase [Sphingomonas populi]|uniref:Bifunctional adenosylcobalamin biosynthesis protein n=1 Tax=Sphingomonas populi TaxID=2484750 RepID=A0A4Q6XZZ1_9SPHN|nr:bifunctional adenosylcobinamide kinase/adenosylcobinamide-phosphate guanylyltransferase [Sphingomonas populi]RZF66120.1 bifunctional adenosylcobinamide kinase/adenosylcobinamide-phosphate guanylyltransferase [Sphingomonas populi]
MTSLFVLGGARSGKSRYAQARAEAIAGELVFIATAQAFDAEMTDRIARHRADRDSRWLTVEAPIALTEAIVEHGAPGRVLLVDCLTLWTSNLLLGEHDIDAATQALEHAITTAPGPVILVANEVGLGIVPDNALARRFRDHAGLLNQRIAAAADTVILVTAGLPLSLK